MLERLQKAIKATRDAGAGIVGLVGLAGSVKTMIASSPKFASHEWLLVDCTDPHSVTQLDLVLRNRLRGAQCIFLDKLLHTESLVKPSLVRPYAENLGPTVLAVVAQDYESLRNLARSPEPVGEFLELEIVYTDVTYETPIECVYDDSGSKKTQRESAVGSTPSRIRRRP